MIDTIVIEKPIYLLRKEVQATFKCQYERLLSVYGLKLNYTVVSREDGTLYSAKRIKKSQWYPPLDDSVLTRPRPTQQSRRSEERRPNTRSASADNSFVEEDMLNRSFLQTHEHSMIEE